MDQTYRRKGLELQTELEEVSVTSNNSGSCVCVF